MPKACDEPKTVVCRLTLDNAKPAAVNCNVWLGDVLWFSVRFSTLLGQPLYL
ncbi:hypothetical protein IH992_29505 [Candidatus Poribacteria bacterium]|nr:hypothetical protein [Candidatus Poribacteria bacterium]